MWPLILVALLGTSVLQSTSAHAQVEHTLVRRLTVFPLKAPKEVSAAAEEAWWQVREALTESKRFLVASRNFLIQKDVYQPRGELSPADAIILGKLLDANALVSMFLDDHTLSMRVVEGDYGRVLWSQDFTLHPSLPISDQLVKASRNLIFDFIASIPYQGFVVVDPLRGKAAYTEKGKLYFRADVGTNAHVEKGDTVQVMRIYSDTLKPLFGVDAVPEVHAEGHVVEVDHEIVVVELDRTSKNIPITELSLVRLPKELKRLRESYALQPSLKTRIDSEYFSPEVTPVQQAIQEKRPLVTSLAFIFNLATFLLLAF